VNNLHIITCTNYTTNSVASRACRARRIERVEPCCSTSSTQPKCMGSTRRTCRVVSCRDMTSQVEFGQILRSEAAESVSEEFV